MLVQVPRLLAIRSAAIALLYIPYCTAVPLALIIDRFSTLTHEREKIRCGLFLKRDYQTPRVVGRSTDRATSEGKCSRVAKFGRLGRHLTSVGVHGNGGYAAAPLKALAGVKKVVEPLDRVLSGRAGRDARGVRSTDSKYPWYVYWQNV